MAAKKTTKKTTKTAKPAAAKTAKAEAPKVVASEKVESILERIQQGFKEAGAALAESGAIMGDKRREILVALIENAQENTDATFSALREALDAETVTDSLRIQRDALRDSIERNVAQVRDIASLAAQSSRESIEPVTGYFANLRDKVKSANA
jgi:hypothetical protein